MRWSELDACKTLWAASAGDLIFWADARIRDDENILDNRHVGRTLFGLVLFRDPKNLTVWVLSQSGAMLELAESNENCAFISRMEKGVF